MSAGAVTNQAGPSSSASKDQKIKRTRKRMRNKKRTTEVEDSSSSGSYDSDDEEVKSKAAPVETYRSLSNKTTTEDSKADEKKDDGDSGDEGEGGDADGKRKRKRKRNTKKKAPEDTSKIASTLSATPSTAKAISLSPEQVGPDPNTDLRLSDQAKQAIQYAQVFTKDRSQWKFNKAKQNWLLRKALSVPPSDYDSALARKQPDSNASAEGTKGQAEKADKGENFVPEDFVLVVSAYLNSVMGGARLRLVEFLKEAVNAPAIKVAPIETEATTEAVKDSATTEKTASGAASGGATKSVSFGNLALETEKTDEAVEAAGFAAGTDPRTVELRRTRATQMLQHMGELL